MNSRSPEFSRANVRILFDAERDADFRHFDRKVDVDWLVAFLESFRQLKWWPPRTDTQRRALRDCYVLRHENDMGRFYEFWSVGARNDRVPPLRIFFHVHEPTNTVRILGVVAPQRRRARQAAILETMAARASYVDTMLVTE